MSWNTLASSEEVTAVGYQAMQRRQRTYTFVHKQLAKHKYRMLTSGRLQAVSTSDPVSTAEKRKNKVRLLLKQEEGKEIFKVASPRNVPFDVVVKVPIGVDAAEVMLLGGNGVLSIGSDRLVRSFSFHPRFKDSWWSQKFATFLVDVFNQTNLKNSAFSTQSGDPDLSIEQTFKQSLTKLASDLHA